MKVMFSQACVSHSCTSAGCVYPSMHLGRVCVFQYAPGQGVCIPVCTWAGDVDRETFGQRCVEGCVDHPPPPSTLLMTTDMADMYPTGIHSSFFLGFQVLCDKG